MTLTAFDKRGNVVPAGFEIFDFRGEPATLLEPTRARSPGRSGKVFVETGSGFRREFYDKVFGLEVREVE